MNPITAEVLVMSVALVISVVAAIRVNRGDRLDPL